MGIIQVAIIIGILYYVFFCEKKEKLTIDGFRYKLSMKYDKETHELAFKRLHELNEMLIKLVRHLRDKYIRSGYQGKKRIWAENIWRRFDPSSVTENSPTGKHDTSWVKNKGDEMSLCVREKSTGKNKIIHDKNILEFVALHEISHIGAVNYGHGEEFWTVFKFVLQEAKEAGLHRPIDYSSSPRRYCGIEVNYNPYFG